MLSIENRKSQVKRPGVGFFLSDLGKSIRRRRRQMLLLGVISFWPAFFLLGMIFLLSFYLMLKLDMIQTEVSRQSDRIHLLRCMGMEKRGLGHMYALDGLLESGLLWLPPIVVWIVRYVLVENDILDVDEYQSLWKIFLPFAMIGVAGMTLLHVGARYIIIKKNLKKE